MEIIKQRQQTSKRAVQSIVTEAMKTEGFRVRKNQIVANTNFKQNIKRSGNNNK